MSLLFIEDGRKMTQVIAFPISLSESLLSDSAAAARKSLLLMALDQAFMRL